METTRLCYYLICRTICSKTSRTVCKGTWLGVQGIKTQAPSDPYQVLGIRRDANETTVKNAYIKLSKQFHPDRNPDNEDAKEMFLQIQNSYREIIKIIETEEPQPEDPSVPRTKYSFTISPLGVENVPPAPMYKRRSVQWILLLIVVMFCIILGQKLTYAGIMKPTESKEAIIKQVTEQYMGEILEEEQEKRQAAKVKTKMEKSLNLFKN